MFKHCGNYCCNYSAREYFLLGMRFLFGSWFLYVGLTKWLMFGADGFVTHITSEFDKTWSPHALNVLLAWLIIIAEPVLAALILIGKHPRCVWTMTTLLMFLLTIGQTILMKPDVINNWQFTIITLVCAALSTSPLISPVSGAIKQESHI